MRTKYKPWAKPYLDDHKEISIDLDNFNLAKNCILEIGSGKGKFLADMALKFPNIEFVGIEKNVTCAGFCAKKIVENNIDNAKIIHGDILNLLEKIPDDYIDTIFLNFSDPWPKKRHEKRRLTSPKFLNEFFRILKKDGRLFYKSDNDDFYAYSLEQFSNCNFTIVSNKEDYDGKDEFDTSTEYEISFRNQGHLIHKVVVKK